MIDTSLLFKIFADDHSYLWQSIINDALISSSVVEVVALLATSGANVFRRVFVQKDDILNI